MNLWLLIGTTLVWPLPPYNCPMSPSNPLQSLSQGLLRHCHVLGTIETEIKFEVRLPSTWNGKFNMGGGGGLVGSLASHWWASGLAKGYATAGTDTGHQGARTGDASAFLNHWERIVNFGYRAIHLTTVNAKIIIRILYDEDIDYSYFRGGSNGGRQALIEAQRHPKDFDGMIGASAPDYARASMVHSLQEALFPIGQALDDPLFPSRNSVDRRGSARQLRS